MSRTITQREFRNSSAAIMDAVQPGETITVTRNGIPVAEVRPIRRRQMVPTATVLENFADLPPMDYERFRTDTDAYFGEDRVGDR